MFMGIFNIKSANCPQVIDWWPMFHHDLTHSGYSTSTAPTTNQTLWNYTTGNVVYSSPAVADGVVFVGSFDHKVYAFAPPTYDVTFVESGLASGTSWSVTFNGVNQSSTSDSIIFSVPNGVYAYSVDVPSGYSSSSTLSGNLTVADENVTTTIVFIREYATVGGGTKSGKLHRIFRCSRISYAWNFRSNCYAWVHSHQTFKADTIKTA